MSNTTRISDQQSENIKDSEKLEKINELITKISAELHILDIKVNVIEKAEYLKRLHLVQKMVDEIKEMFK